MITRAATLDRRPARAARARDINGGHTAFNKTPCDINGNAKPDFFDDDGNGKRGNDRRNGGSNTTPIAITALLNGFLDGIEMQNEGIRFDLIDRAARIVDASGLPLIADADNGYGGPLNVRRTIMEFERAGVAAVMIACFIAAGMRP